MAPCACVARRDRFRCRNERPVVGCATFGDNGSRRRRRRLSPQRCRWPTSRRRNGAGGRATYGDWLCGVSRLDSRILRPPSLPPSLHLHPCLLNGAGEGREGGGAGTLLLVTSQSGLDCGFLRRRRRRQLRRSPKKEAAHLTRALVCACVSVPKIAMGAKCGPLSKRCMATGAASTPSVRCTMYNADSSFPLQRVISQPKSRAALKKVCHFKNTLPLQKWHFENTLPNKFLLKRLRDSCLLAAYGCG